MRYFLSLCWDPLARTGPWRSDSYTANSVNEPPLARLSVPVSPLRRGWCPSCGRRSSQEKHVQGFGPGRSRPGTHGGCPRVRMWGVHRALNKMGYTVNSGHWQSLFVLLTGPNVPSLETTPSSGTSTARPHPRAAFPLGLSLPPACHSLLPPSEDARSPSPSSVDSSSHIALSTALGVINSKLTSRGNFQFGYIYFPKDTDYIPRNTSTGAPSNSLKSS